MSVFVGLGSGNWVGVFFNLFCVLSSTTGVWENMYLHIAIIVIVWHGDRFGISYTFLFFEMLARA